MRELNRCNSIAEVSPQIPKRCMLSSGHPINQWVQHMWVEAIRSDGRRQISTWGRDKRVTTIEYEPVKEHHDG